MENEVDNLLEEIVPLLGSNLKEQNIKRREIFRRLKSLDPSFFSKLKCKLTPEQYENWQASMKAEKENRQGGRPFLKKKIRRIHYRVQAPEFLVAFKLETLNVSTVHMPEGHKGYDLLILDDVWKRVQVKASDSERQFKTYLKKSNNELGKKYDVLVFVKSDGTTYWFDKSTKKKTNWTRNCEWANDIDVSETLKFLKACGDRKWIKMQVRNHVQKTCTCERCGKIKLAEVF